jgi:anti-sigma factor RsiW
MKLRRREDDHVWSQSHLSHYVEGDLSWRQRRRLELHAKDCPDCSRGILALRALLRLMRTASDRSRISAPTSIFDRVRADAIRGSEGADKPANRDSSA